MELPSELEALQAAVTTMIAATTLEQDNKTIADIARRVRSIQTFRELEKKMILVDAVVTKWQARHAAQHFTKFSFELSLLRRAETTQKALQAEQKRIRARNDRRTAKYHNEKTLNRDDVILSRLSQIESKLSHSDARKQLEKDLKAHEAIEKHEREKEAGLRIIEEMRLERAKAQLKDKTEEQEIREAFSVYNVPESEIIVKEGNMEEITIRGIKSPYSEMVSNPDKFMEAFRRDDAEVKKLKEARLIQKFGQALATQILSGQISEENATIALEAASNTAEGTRK